MTLVTIFGLLKKPLVIYIILGIVCVLGFKRCNTLKLENTVLQTNYKAAVYDKNIQQTISKYQYEKYYYTLAMLTEKAGVKDKDVQSVTQIKYIYKDSIKIKDSTSIKYVYIRDTTTKKYNFIASKDCYTVMGNSNSPDVKLTNVNFNDTITAIGYATYNHHFLFIRWGKVLNLKAVSGCGGNTTIINNIKIE